MQSQLKFPRHMDQPTRLLFWTIDQIVPFSTLMLVGMITGTLLTSCLLGIAIAWGLSRYRDSRPDGYLQHMAYWYGVVPMKGRTALNPFERKVYPQ